VKALLLTYWPGVVTLLIAALYIDWNPKPE
jgi:hypothetical protein